MSLQSDVEKLKNSPSLDVKERITTKISYYIDNDMLEEAEQAIALQVIELLARDTEVSIRKILSNNLSACSTIPHTLALRLSQDVEEVAVPMIEFSPLLSQNDLVEIVRSTKQCACLSAVARRKDVSQILAESLIDTQEEAAIETLVENKTAGLAEKNINKILKAFASSGSIMNSLVDRGGLPINIVAQIYTKASEELKNQLAKKYHLDEETAQSLADSCYEEATLDLLSLQDSEKAMQLVTHLDKQKKLNPAIILRALCKGHFSFFEAALARRAKVTFERAHNMVWEQGSAGFGSLYKSASMPSAIFDAVDVLHRFTLQTVKSGNITDSEEFARRLIEHIVQEGYDKKMKIMRHLLVLIDSKVDTTEVP